MNTKIGGPIIVKYAKNKEAKHLISDQVRDIYEEVESESVVNVNRIKQEIKDDKLTRGKDEGNPYQKIVVNNRDKDNIHISQMDHWSILCNIVSYLQYDRN